MLVQHFLEKKLCIYIDAETAGESDFARVLSEAASGEKGTALVIGNLQFAERAAASARIPELLRNRDGVFCLPRLA